MKTTTYFIVTGILVAAWVGAAAAPFTAAFAKTFLASADPLDVTRTQLTLAAGQFGLLGAILMLSFARSRADISVEMRPVQETLTKLASRVDGGFVRTLRDDEFYPDFEAAMSSAQSHVYISYFSPEPPDRTHHKQRKTYYKGQAALFKKKSSVKFRRLMRRSSANLEWVQQFIEDASGLPNCSVAILEDRPETESDPLALSVQIVDGKRAWFVALEGHERQKEWRDLHIDSELFATAMSTYYHRLWEKATVVLRDGHITEEGHRLISDQKAEH